MSGSGISWAICKSAHRSRQITMPAPTAQFFTGRMPFLPPIQQRQCTEGKLDILYCIVLYKEEFIIVIYKTWSRNDTRYVTNRKTNWRLYCTGGCQVISLGKISTKLSIKCYSNGQKTISSSTEKETVALYKSILQTYLSRLCVALAMLQWLPCLQYTHTHPFNTPFPGLPRWAGTRKVKPIWILLKQETVSGSGVRWAICKSAPRSRQITTPAPHHSVFYRPDALPAAQPTASKHWRHWYRYGEIEGETSRF